MVWGGVTRREWYHAELGVHELEEMVCHADVDMDDRVAMIRYNVMTTVRGHKSGPPPGREAIHESAMPSCLSTGGEARPTSVPVCESRSRRRGDPELSQGGAGGE
ncbi:hypothetical protein Syun_003363 [Stephania yunnanensis]|uniref:Uncharacterized protein n=1 Tax=Stephania yunnanensis TaxID=152371 RepID=A0AAP0Q3T9_9MAGN